MTIDEGKPLQVGQVLEGLLEVPPAAGPDGGRPGEPPAARRRGNATPRMTLWERMMVAVELKFDGDNDGDVRGKG